MKKLQLLIPMGGLGQRFRDQGYTQPKPLIQVDGLPMFMRALSSFEPYRGEIQSIFVVRQDAEETFGLATSITEILPSAKLMLLGHNTRGAVETCMEAAPLIDPNLPLVVMDCDFYFSSSSYFTALEGMVEHGDADGLLLSFCSSSDRYSYAKIDPSGWVTETAEKVVISHHALAGAYGFTSGALFLTFAKQFLAKPIGQDLKEYYLSLLYRVILDAGYRIRMAYADRFDSFGTPEELTEYCGRI